jgi:GT2 family glycosyltransferase
VSNYRSLSILTLLRGRQDHFDHLLAGLSSQTRQPDEIIVAYMQDEPPTLPRKPVCPIRCIRVPGDPLPLAKARNEAAKAASGDILAFLDVDCIPDPEFVRRIDEVFEEDRSGVYLPEVRYLPACKDGWFDDASTKPDYSRLEHEALRHPAKPDVYGEAAIPIDDYGELWGLAFALSFETWRNAGGMDEAYIGYGAEETDFAERLATIEAPLFWLGGTLCFHQHHAVHKPPLQHFASIVRNAQLFRERWGKWCMDYWLDDFEKRGLIARHDDTIEVLREPSAQEVNATKQGPEVRFS